MADSHRRIVLKPPGLSQDRLNALRLALREAVRIQHEAAAISPHVLELRGDLGEEDAFFFIEHEPAEPIDASALFNPVAPVLDIDRLLQAQVGLADGLRAVHGRENSKHSIHGGVCPGVVLTVASGLFKITDFGWAPAICRTLGTESYLELAVGPGDPRGPCPGEVCWEILRPDDGGDSRISGFIDPYKYGNNALDTFERPSDIVSLGIVLHVLAERRHPFLTGLEDHRYVATSETMAYLLYDRARRPELRDSTNPAVVRWCDLVARMLSAHPPDRPAVGQILVQMGEVGVQPADKTLRFMDLLNHAAALLNDRNWEEAEKMVAPLLSGGDIPSQIVEQASKQSHHARLGKIIDQAHRLSATDQWREAEPLLQGLMGGGPPDELKRAAEKLRARHQKFRGIIEQLNDIEKKAKDVTTSEPHLAAVRYEEFMATVQHLPAEGIPPSLSHKRTQVLETLTTRRDYLLKHGPELAAQDQVARDWYQGAQQAWAQEDWTSLEQRFQTPPQRQPKDVRAGVAELEQRYEFVKPALAWIGRLPKKMSEEALAAIESLLADAPDVRMLPPGLAKKIHQLAEKLSLVVARTKDHQRAMDWLTQVRQAAQAANWPEAKRCLLNRPRLDHWPAEVLQEEKILQTRIDQQIAEVERLRLAIETWLNKADAEAGRGDFDQAIHTLESPPFDPAQFPKTTAEEVQDRLTQYQTRQKEKLDAAIRERDEAARRAADRLARELVTGQFPELLDPAAIRIQLESLNWAKQAIESRGNAKLTIVLPQSAGDAGKKRHDIEFLSSATKLTVTNAEPLRKSVTAALTDGVRTLQQSALDQWRPEQTSLFPGAKTKASLDRPTRDATVRVLLFGDHDSAAALPIELAWDPRTLQWSPKNPNDWSRRLEAFVVDRALPLVKPSLLSRSALLAGYESSLSVELGPPSKPPGKAADAIWPLEGRAHVALNETADHRVTAAFPVRCLTKGKLQVEADPAPIEAKLAAAILTAQTSAKAALERTLRDGLQKLPVKVKLIGLTKFGRRPIESLDYKIGVKRGGDIQVSAPWNAKSLQFDLSDNWAAPLQELKAPVVDRSGRRRRASIAVAAMAIVAAIGGIWIFGTGDGKGPPPPPPPPPETSNDPKPHDIVPQEPEPEPEAPTPSVSLCEERRGKIANLLKENWPTEFSSAGLDSFITCEENGDRLCYKIPGLCHEPPGATGESKRVCYQPCEDLQTLSPAELAGRIQKSLDGLKSLLERARLAPAELRENLAESVKESPHLDRNLVHPSLVTVSWNPDAEPTWTWDAEKDAWNSNEFTPRIQLAGVELEASNLTDFRIRFRVKDGSLTATGSDDRTDDPGWLERLSVKVVQEANAHASRLQTTAKGAFLVSLAAIPPETGWNLEGDNNPQAMGTAITWILSHDRFLPRRFQASWDAQKLEFVGHTPESTRHELTELAKLLANVDAASGREEAAWLRKPYTAEAPPLLYEFSIPDKTASNGISWVFEVHPPWSKAGSRPSPEKSLHIHAILTATTAGLAIPSYWPIIAAYSELRDGKLGSLEQEVLNALPAKDNEILKQFDSTLFSPQIKLDLAQDPAAVTWEYRSDQPQNALMTLEGALFWIVSPNSDLPSGIKIGNLEKLVNENTPKYRFEITLSSPDGKLSEMKVVLKDTPANRAKAEELFNFQVALKSHDQRSATEKELAAIFQTAAGKPLTEVQFFNALKSIWSAKSAGAAGVIKCIGAVDCQKQIKARINDQDKLATVFLEYFNGPSETYAIAWTDKKQLDSRIVKIGNIGSGQELAGSVLEAVLPSTLSAYEELRYTVGVAIGTDTGLERITELKFNPISISVKSSIDEGKDPISIEISSLSELNVRKKDDKLKCDLSASPALNGAKSAASKRSILLEKLNQMP